MKFIETLNATFVNCDQISYIGHEWHEKTDAYYSYLYLKNGEKFDFFEVPASFHDQDMEEHEFDCDHLITWHRYAAILIAQSQDVLINNQDLMDKAFEFFMRDYQKLKRMFKDEKTIS